MLHVWIRAQTSPLAVWHTDDQQWHTVASWQQLQESYQDYQSGHKKTLCLYFPSHHALQVATSLDSAKLKQLGVTGKQYLFEEMSLTPAEQLTVRQVGHGNRHQLYALATSDIEAWAQSASLAGFDISALLPDFLLLPAPAEGAGQQVSLYQDDYTTLLRQSDDYGMAVSYLPLIAERLPQLSEICLLPAVTDSKSNLSTSGVNHDAIYAIAKDHALVVSKPDILPTPIKMPDRHALNFFTKVSDTKLSPYLRAALMVAMSALVLQMATDALQVYRYDQASAMTQVATAAQYEAWFPDERLNPRVNLQSQLQPKLRGDAQTASDHMAALSRISPLIKQSALKARALNINMQPSMLSFTLIASDRGSLDQFVNTLNQQGLSARLERVGNQNQGEDNREISGEVIVDIISQGST